MKFTRTSVRASLLRKVAAAVLVVAATGATITSTTGSAEALSGTIGGNQYGGMTYSVVPPTFGGVQCRSDFDQVSVFVNGGNVGTFWTYVEYYNVATGAYVRPGWTSSTNAGNVIGPNPTRWLTGAVGTWLVWLQIGYYDAYGTFRTTYSQWVPSYTNFLPGQVYMSLAPTGSTCVVR